jgi:hypothetical protein
VIRAGGFNQQDSNSAGTIQAGGKRITYNPLGAFTGNAVSFQSPNFNATKGDLLLVAVSIQDGGLGDLFDCTFNGVSFVLNAINVDFPGLNSIYLLALNIGSTVLNAPVIVTFGAAHGYAAVMSRFRGSKPWQLKMLKSFISGVAVTNISSTFTGAQAFSPQIHYGIIETNGPPGDALGVWQNSMKDTLQRPGQALTSLKEAYRIPSPYADAEAHVIGQTSRFAVAICGVYAQT